MSLEEAKIVCQCVEQSFRLDLLCGFLLWLLFIYVLIVWRRIEMYLVTSEDNPFEPKQPPDSDAFLDISWNEITKPMWQLILLRQLFFLEHLTKTNQWPSNDFYRCIGIMKLLSSRNFHLPVNRYMDNIIYATQSLVWLRPSSDTWLQLVGFGRLMDRSMFGPRFRWP